jgi:hypothetical protein
MAATRTASLSVLVASLISSPTKTGAALQAISFWWLATTTVRAFTSNEARHTGTDEKQ